MKKSFSMLMAAAYALCLSAEVYAQRGPRYNPPGGGGGGSSRSSGSSSSSSSGSRSSGSSSSSSSRTSSGPRYSPPSSSSSSSSSSRPSSRPSSSSSSSSSSSRPSGPRYNPPSSSSSSSSTTVSRPSSSSSSSSTTSTRPTGPRYNPPSTGSSSGSTSSTRPTGPRYNPPGSSTGPVVGPIRRPTPVGPRYNPPLPMRGGVVIRRTIYHVPYITHHGVIRWSSPRMYYSSLNRRYIYRRWVLEPCAWHYHNGYWDMDGYPYYVHRGYRYRYHPVETCQYELVDSEGNVTVKTYPEAACGRAYDTCASERDTMNNNIGAERYFCAEAVDEDLSAPDTTTYNPTDISAERTSAIASFLANKDFKDLYKQGRESEIGDGKCTIKKIGGLFNSGNKYDCKYLVQVGGKTFPLVDESICSDDSQAEAVGCNVGSEKENAGCILQNAIEAGLCI